jgi:hypothetical protein
MGLGSHRREGAAHDADAAVWYVELAIWKA